MKNIYIYIYVISDNCSYIANVILMIACMGIGYAGDMLGCGIFVSGSLY